MNKTLCYCRESAVHSGPRPVRIRVHGAFFLCNSRAFVNTWGEVTSQNLRSRYYRHFVGDHAWSRGTKIYRVPLNQLLLENEKCPCNY